MLSRFSQLFRTEEGLHQHNRQVHQYYCEDCEEVYGSEWALTQHYIQSPHHHYCRFCDEHFEDDDVLEEHNDDEHECCNSCDKVRSVTSSLDATMLNPRVLLRYSRLRQDCISIIGRSTGTASPAGASSTLSTTLTCTSERRPSTTRGSTSAQGGAVKPRSSRMVIWLYISNRVLAAVVSIAPTSTRWSSVAIRSTLSPTLSG